jgi:carbonic anhydrase
MAELTDQNLPDRFEDVLTANATWAGQGEPNTLPARAAKGLAVLTCMDSRISPLAQRRGPRHR